MKERRRRGSVLNEELLIRKNRKRKGNVREKGKRKNQEVPKKEKKNSK